MKRNIFMFGLMFLIIFALSFTPFKSDEILPAFPGAEGFGSKTPGGRYGKILFVTNLKDTLDSYNPDYPGSLRWALEHTWPDDSNSPYDQRRIIIFKVGGTIELKDELLVRYPYVTIAGQTASGDGIMIRGDQVRIVTHDVIVRNLRVRVGDEGGPTCCRDGINIDTGKADTDVYNIIIDHSSVSWAIDENFSTWSSNEKPYKIYDVTVQWSIFSEALYDSIHIDEGETQTAPHSMGMILGQDGYNISIHHNLFAHNWARNPRLSGMVNAEIINNVVYGWNNRGVEISGDRNVAHVINNYFVRTSDEQGPELYFKKPMLSESRVFVQGNLTDDITLSEGAVSSHIDISEDFSLSSGYVFEPSNIKVLSSSDTYNDVLSFAGAVSPIRDEVDQRVVENVTNRTGQIIDSQDEVGGWPVFRSVPSPLDTDNDGIPDDWELAHALDINSASDANNPDILAPSGYTWLEEYMNSLMISPVEKQEPSIWSEGEKYFVSLLLVLVVSVFLIERLGRNRAYRDLSTKKRHL